MTKHATILLLLLAAAFGGPALGQTRDLPDGTIPSVWRDGGWEDLDPSPTLADTLISLRVTTGNNLGLTIYNNGFIGTNLVNRSPSMEYPLRSGQEHLVRAGIWVGGLPASGADTLVTTATIDGRMGSFDPKQISEFFPARTGIQERSILLNSCCYDADAKSEQDFSAAYFDSYPDLSPQHRPLGIRVELETLLFSFEPFDAIVIANYKIINTNLEDPIYNVYAGMYAELASGWKDGHPEWPPSGWFSRKDIGFIDSLRIVTEHRYDYEGGASPSWAGISLLGTRPRPIGEMHVSSNWWNWDPNLTQPGTPRNDKERYETMSNRSIDGTAGSEAPNNDPVELLSVGPLGDLGADGLYVLEPGDTVTVSFAFVGGRPSPREGRTAEEDLVFNAGWAQTAFDLNFNIPVPPPSPTLLTTPTLGKLTLRWTRDPEEFIDPKSHKKDFEGYRIYVSESKEEEGFRLLHQADLVDSLLENTGLEALRDSVRIDGIDYQYSYDIEGLRDGFKYWVSVTSFDTGAADIAPLESGRAQNRTFAIPGGPAPDKIGTVKVFPNPYRGDAAWDGTLPRDRYLWFVNLPDRCTIRIYTLAGDLVDTIEFNGSTYDATEIRGIFDPTDTRNPESDIPVLSGGMAAWDLISRADQGIATGLYIFSVKDHATGDTQLGKFLVLR